MLDIGKHNKKARESVITAVDRLVGPQNDLVTGVGKESLNVMEVLGGQSKLFEVVRALHTSYVARPRAPPERRAGEAQSKFR